MPLELFLVHWVTAYEGNPSDPVLRRVVHNFVYRNELDPNFTCPDAIAEKRSFKELLDSGIDQYLRHALYGNQD